LKANPDGSIAVTGSAYHQALYRWLEICNVRDENGLPVKATPHQFRHTYATRLVNKELPLEIIRQLLDHSSMEMTAHYARLTDKTVREQWERACKVDHQGHAVMLADDSPLATAGWMKHNLARVKMALPNGYCGLPLQQSCPHANACLDCPVFVTTGDFLPQHRTQLASTERLIATATADGHFRLAEMNERVAGNLRRIVTALETDDREPQP